MIKITDPADTCCKSSELFLILINTLILSLNINAQVNSLILPDSLSFHTNQSKNVRHLQEDNSTQIFENFSPEWYNIITNIASDFLDFGEGIMDKKNIKPIILLSSVTAGLIISDQKNWAQSKTIFENNKNIKQASILVVNLGEAKWQLGLAGLGELMVIYLIILKFPEHHLKVLRLLFHQDYLYSS
jgi:hypothetical protein